MRFLRFTRLLVLCGALLLLSVGVAAQRGGGNNNAIATLKGVAIPQPDLTQYVADRQTLIVLGKALFWDQQVGSDGRTACATCHFHAGADHRAGASALEDFPFRVFADATDNRSAVVRDSSRRLGSAGVLGQVTARNAPTVINAVFHPRTFLDGRASDLFTGLTPFGDSDPRANAAALVDGQVVPEMVRLT